ALLYTATDGAYIREVKPDARKLNSQVVDSNANANAFTSQTRGQLGSRQILARNLYCLAQLIIPRDFEFPGMKGATNALNRARIRATAIAQWAVNVVDFRDADVAMTRFEFDILPFGSNAGPAANFGTGSPGGLPAKLAYWSPDRIQHNNNKQFVGVVWGMEMPELLLTETLATHDKRLKDTDMDTTGKSTTDAMSPDDDLDQFRFPLASLFLELYNPRTTDVATNALIPGAPSSLYNTATMSLDLGRLAPLSIVDPFNPTTPLTSTSPTWGRQPVWRIALSEMYPASSTDHPQAKLTATTSTARTFETVTHQWSTEQVSGGPVSEKVLGGATNLDHTNANLQYVEQYIGTGLHYDLANQSTAPPAGFERFIWFTDFRPTQYQLIPDILPTIRTAGHEKESVYTASTAGASLAGGSYMVLGPRAQTSFGSLTHNQFTGKAYPTILTKMAMGDANPATSVRPILSPSFQGITLSGASVNTNMLNNVSANQPWLSRTKTAQSLICTTPAPTTSGWATAFTGGIGINISMPPPVAGQTIWLPANVPTTKLNTTDTTGGPRTDNSDGFGSPIMPPDSWIDVATASTLNKLPDTPIDYSNPMLTGRLNTGTYENVRAAYLQRLADPDFPYDPVTNPYITVDWMSIDLTVLNGEAPMGSDPKDTPVAVKFQSRYKNGSLSPLATGHDVQADKGISYYSPMTGNLRTTAPQTSVPTISITGTPSVNPESYFMYQLGYDKQAYTGNIGNSASTFGYCNAGYFLDSANPSSLPNAGQMAQPGTATWNFFDGFGPPNDATNPAYKGAPTRLAGVTWFNRPFVSPYELMMVPLTGPSLFGLHHSAYASVQNRELNSFVPSYQTTNAWNVDLRHDVPAVTPVNQPSVQSYWAKPEPLTAGTRLADWPLLLEFVETQPPFIDANKYYRPDTMLALAQTDNLARRFLNSFLPAGYSIPETGSGASLAISEPYTVRGPSLLAPYNMKPSYVAAGKINLNTIAFDSTGHSRALKAIEHNYL
ncbi:MAG TPA: hypothetical protein VM260_20455, partial [Pirellula sp.]|nr:hypothetical protein [Pirellula sp.]